MGKFKAFQVLLTLTDTATDGRALGRHDGIVTFVEGGVPGDTAMVEIYKREGKAYAARIAEIVTPSPDRTTPRCQHFGVCGGCKWQHLSYAQQLRFKQNQVLNTLRRIGKVDPETFMPIIGMDSPYYYRNKLEFTFSRWAWLTREQMQHPPEHQDSLGFHVPGVFDKVLDISTCYLQTPLIDDIRNELRRFALAQDYPFYDIRQHTGFLRNVIFRTSVHTGELMLILVVARDNPEAVGQIFTHLTGLFPAISSCIWILNTKVNSMYSDLPVQVWRGPAYYTDRLGEYDFRVRPASFFQPNPRQATRLYEVVRHFLQQTLPAGVVRHQVIYDLYSGTGSIGIFVSDLAARIIGIEYVDSAVADAWENVRLNQLPETQFEFLAGDMRHLLTPALTARTGTPDVIIADPPRQGMDAPVVEQILHIRPRHIIYVSCKPATQARDILLMKKWYEVLGARPVDMFPHTAHVENVVLMRLRETPLADEEVQRLQMSGTDSETVFPDSVTEAPD
ncbi:MAG: 23S rRNA (uracil(1939)-C(5))-methyltransferase RlmD [Bacteroidia bacterium]|nr:23S rRNA (uracil(1939)-C(5))-methyltransferase RlmD [Bacteroidia bacterium]